jgi:CubicO group peptidase (beta-lactamase class C family)
MCVTLADLALVGQLMVQGGRREGVQVIPEKWIDDLASGGDAAAWNAGSFVEYYPGLPMRYRSKWYALDGKMPMLSGMGIHGQNLYVDRANEIVIAKLSSQPLPLDAAQVATTTREIDAIRSALAPIQ